MDIEYVGEVAEDDKWDIEQYLNDEEAGTDFLVCDEEGREEAVTEYIEQSLWAFNPGFLVHHMPESITVEALTKLQELYEDANPILYGMIVDIEDFVDDAVSADGYGHFLAPYDHEEIEYTTQDGEETYYIYRRN